MARFVEWFAPRTVPVVDEGRVHCPVAQADVDVERCLTCMHRQEFRRDETSRRDELVCRPPTKTLASARLYAWTSGGRRRP